MNKHPPIPMPVRDTILIVTAGRSDLQIVLQGEQQEFEGRRIHEYLLEHIEKIRLVSTHRNLPRNRASPISDLSIIAQQMAPQSEGLRLALPKLEFLLERANVDLRRIGIAVILQTCRDPAACGPQLLRLTDKEPIAAGPIMARWLAEQCGLEQTQEKTPQIGRSLWFDFLRGGEDQSDASFRDQINLIAIQRIDQLLRQSEAAMLAQGIKAPQMILADSGGLPRFKEPLAALVQLRFSGRTTIIHESETQLPGASETGRVSVQESCQARLIARKLLRIGDIIGAANAVAHLAGDKREHDWLAPLQQAAQFMRGDPVRGEPFPELAALRQLGHLSILPALRTETAVASGRITEAITQVFTFSESIVKDGIEKWLITGDVDADTPPGSIREDLPTAIKKQLAATDPSTPKARPAYDASMHFGRLRFNLEAMAETWCSAIDEMAEGGSWQQLNRVLFPKNSFSEQRRLRNLHTHSCLTEEDVNQARKLFHDRKVWRDPKLAGEVVPVGHCFLATPHAAGVLTKLTGEKVHVQYQRLIKALTDRLLDHRYAILPEENTTKENS